MNTFNISSTSEPPSRRAFLKAFGTLCAAGAAVTLAGCDIAGVSKSDNIAIPAATQSKIRELGGIVRASREGIGNALLAAVAAKRAGKVLDDDEDLQLDPEDEAALQSFYAAPEATLDQVAGEYQGVQKIDLLYAVYTVLASRYEDRSGGRHWGVLLRYRWSAEGGLRCGSSRDAHR